MREILVCVTFREFDGGINARTQHVFLESLRKQTYKNFRFIVTNYREKLVKKTLDESNLPYEFHQSERLDCRFSWTEVIQNSFQHLERGQKIIMGIKMHKNTSPDTGKIVFGNLMRAVYKEIFRYRNYRRMIRFMRDNYCKENDNLVGCEIGVAHGANARSMFHALPIKKLYLVDSNEKG